MAQTDSWREFTLRKRLAEQSKVFLFDNNGDRLRELELISWIEKAKYVAKHNGTLQIRIRDMTGKAKDKTEKTVEPRKFLVNAYEGLKELQRDPETDTSKWTNPKPLEQQTGIQALANQLTGNTVSLTEAIRMIDGAIKNEDNPCPVIAVFTGITRQEDAKLLDLPLQNWAHHTALANTKSTVFVSTPNVALFDEHTRRQAVIVEPPLSTWDERKGIIQNAIQNYEAEFPKVKFDDSTVKLTSGLTLHDLTAILNESISTKGNINPAFVTDAKMAQMKKLGYELVYPKYGWEALGGYSELREYYEQNLIENLDDKTAQSWKLEGARGVIELGPPGTGKSLRAKCLAKVTNLPFIKIDASTVSSQWYGESERKVRQLIKVIQANSPCIVQVDEIDQLFLKRHAVTDSAGEASRRTMDIVMDYLGDDDRTSTFIGATNRPLDMDIAATRAGRFDDLIPVLWPDRQARKQILHVHMQVVRKIPEAGLTEQDKDNLADDLAMYSGAEIANFVTKAARIARARKQENVTYRDFQDAINTRPKKLDEAIRELETYVKDTESLDGIHQQLLKQQADRLKKEIQVIRKSRQATAAVE